jgi:hypothetical protein
MKTLWHRLVSRHKRLKAELVQVELEMAKDTPLIPIPTLFPQKPYKISTVILLTVFTFFAAIAVWISFRELIVPLLQ